MTINISIYRHAILSFNTWWYMFILPNIMADGLKINILCNIYCSNHAEWSIRKMLICTPHILINSLYSRYQVQIFSNTYVCRGQKIWTASSEFGTYRLCEQRRFRRACASAQSRQNLRCSLIEAMTQEEPSDRKPDPWPLWMAGHAQLKFVMTECSKTQVRWTGPLCEMSKSEVHWLLSWHFQDKQRWEN